MGEDYYFVDLDGEIGIYADEDDQQDLAYYNVANYCRDEEIMTQRALHETLSRLLWRYSEQHGGDPEWDGNNKHWSVMANDGNMDFTVASAQWIKESTVYFGDYAVARAAIEDVVKPFCAAHPEFVW